MVSQPPAQQVPAVADRVLAVVGALLVVLSLLWAAEFHRRVGLLLFTEQVLALALGLTLAGGWLLTLGKAGAARAAALLLAALSLALLGWLAWNYGWATLAMMRRPATLTAGAAAILAGLMFLVWRRVGLGITVILGVFALLALYGRPLGIPTIAADRLALYLTIDPNGMLGLPLRVAVEIVLPFLLFGRLLQVSGGSLWFTSMAELAFGRYRGGAAKVAIAGSAALGSISGNAVSNVVGTGVVTIPLMKRSGFRPDRAAAIESVASTGGQLLPPVMGTAAFVMADFLRIPYSQVLLAALVPALLYFFAVFVQVDRMALRDGIAGLRPDPEVRAGRLFLAGVHFLLPFVALLLAFMAFQSRPQVAALSAVGLLVVLAMLRPFQGQRLGLTGLLRAVADTGIAAVPVLLITAAAGLLIGLINISGLGFSLANSAIALAGGNLLALLVIVALAAIVLGMGMPTVAVYVLLATLLAPALERVGIGGIQAHLFILYFGMLSMVTPPIALASITAAHLAEASPWRSSVEALRLAWIAYLVPFLFVFSPSLVLAAPWPWVLLTLLTAGGGIFAVCMALGDGRRLPPALRWALAAAGLALLLPPGLGAAAIGFNLAGALGLAVLLLMRRREPVRPGPAIDPTITTTRGDLP